MNTISNSRFSIFRVLAITAIFSTVWMGRAHAQDLVITGVIDGPLTGGVPKAIELYVVNDIDDLGIYGVSSANNGGGTSGAPEFTLPNAPASAGDYFYIASESPQFTAFFGIAPNATSGAASINGDDAIELYENGVVIDVFGEVDTDGSGQPWEYLDGWAYRNSDSGPDGTSFVIGNWQFSGPNALDGETTNATAAVPFPLGTFASAGGDSAPRVVATTPAEGANDVAVDASIEIVFSEPVTISGAWFDLSCSVSGVVTGAVASADSIVFTVDPDMDLTVGEQCSLTVFAANVADIDADDPPDTPAADFVLNFEVDNAGGIEGVIINEINADPDTSAGDANGDGAANFSDDEFVEIVNTTGAALDVSGWTLSDGFSLRHTFPAGSVIDDGCAIVVFGGGAPAGAFGGALTQIASGGSLGLNNGGDTITLNDGSRDAASESYGSEGGSNQSLTRDPDLTGAFVQHTTVGSALFSPGTRNDGSTFDGCSVSILDAAIYEVQGNANASPLTGNIVRVEGVVTGDFQDGDADTQSSLRGFYLQDAIGDGDAATSDGIFVFDGSAPGVDVNPGDVLRVVGVVDEFFGETQIEASSVEVLAVGGSVAPAELMLPAVGVIAGANSPYIADLERFEGMLVRVSQTLTVADLFNLDRFGEIPLLAGGRSVQFTNNNAPDAIGFDASLQDLAARRLMLDDGLALQNPDPIRYPAPGLPNAVGNVVRSGDTVAGLTGNIRYSRGSGSSGTELYRLMPTQEPVFVAANPRPEVPAVGGGVTVASFNVLNFFSTIDLPGSECGPNLIGCRGADSALELERQLTKLVSAIVALDADVVGLIEIENNASASLQLLVDAINDSVGSQLYDFVDAGVIGGDAIKVALIYKPDTIALVGTPAVLDSSIDARFLDQKNRPVLAQSFSETATAGVFTVAVNHLKSKGSDCEDVGDPDVGDGQGNCNVTRTLAAEATVDWLATDPTGSGDTDIIVIGDMNAYLQEDPINAYRAGGYTNLLDTFIGGEAYTFIFGGQIGALDHAFATPAALDQVTGAAIWHSNADEADALDYNLDFGRNADIYAPDAARASDHDAVIVGLNLVGDLDGDGVSNANDVCPNTMIPESVPTKRLLPFRYALVDGDNVFDTGKRALRTYTTTDTAGCSCSQIIDELGLGKLQEWFGCGSFVMWLWTRHVAE